ncbi:hypothetical protein CVT25_004972 [Psilocybe cyanescens]|uniref:SAP domain-containing protein n=1 Tax=Psilocybe cyanescens TaxID=93625 RepID=A0A409XTU1_PSICY|nr:hypothetical protein CVT25_004972 [Psilocybe cyanescens]
MPPPPYTKPITSMNKQELKNLCDHFGQVNEGLVKALRQRLKRYLNNHREELAQNPDYQRLYPRRRGRAPTQQPDHSGDEEENNQNSDENSNGDEQLAASDFSSFHGCEIPNNGSTLHSDGPPSSRTLSTIQDMPSPPILRTRDRSTPSHGEFSPPLTKSYTSLSFTQTLLHDMV